MKELICDSLTDFWKIRGFPTPKISNFQPWFEKHQAIAKQFSASFPENFKQFWAWVENPIAYKINLEAIYLEGIWRRKSHFSAEKLDLTSEKCLFRGKVNFSKGKSTFPPKRHFSEAKSNFSAEKLTFPWKRHFSEVKSIFSEEKLTFLPLFFNFSAEKWEKSGGKVNFSAEKLDLASEKCLFGGKVHFPLEKLTFPRKSWT